MQQLEPVMREWKPVLSWLGCRCTWMIVHTARGALPQVRATVDASLGVEVRMVDERLTSHAAEQALLEGT
jgi:RNase H-fold protein (predicted Holliday junction resolvase)